MDPDGDEAKSFRLNEDGGIDLKKILPQNRSPKPALSGFRNRVDIRTVKRVNFLDGKLYHIARENRDTAATVGSSNFTRRGLGFGAIPNIQLNLKARDENDRKSLIRWFDDLWSDETLTRLPGNCSAGKRRTGSPGGCPGSRSEGEFLNLLELSKRVASETAYHGEIWPVRGLVTVAVLACSDGSLMDDQMRRISAEAEQLDSAGGDSGPAACRRLEAGNGGAVREARVRSQL